MTSHLNIDILTQLHTILLDKGWGAEIERRKSGKKLFEIFAVMFEEMTKNQADLILNLLQNFVRYNIETYPTLINAAVNDINFSDHSTADTVFFIPLVHWGHIKKASIKSGHDFIYYVRNLPFRELAPPIANAKHISVPDYTHLSNPQHAKRINNACFVFIDDFTGTGDTAIRTINEVIDEYDIDKNDIYFISLVAMEYGLNRIYEYGIKAGIAKIESKGISESPHFKNNIPEMIDLMISIEKSIPVPDKYSLGYGRSEALVSMIRTPNNTFPIFWYDNNNSRDVPFPRH